MLVQVGTTLWVELDSILIVRVGATGTEITVKGHPETLTSDWQADRVANFVRDCMELEEARWRDTQHT